MGTAMVTQTSKFNNLYIIRYGIKCWFNFIETVNAKNQPIPSYWLLSYFQIRG